MCALVDLLSAAPCKCRWTTHHVQRGSRGKEGGLDRRGKTGEAPQKSTFGMESERAETRRKRRQHPRAANPNWTVVTPEGGRAMPSVFSLRREGACCPGIHDNSCAPRFLYLPVLLSLALSFSLINRLCIILVSVDARTVLSATTFTSSPMRKMRRSLGQLWTFSEETGFLPFLR